MNDAVKEDLIMMHEDFEEKLSFSSTKFELPLENMKKSVPICVNERARLAEVLEIMQGKRIGSVLITNEKNELKGIITERDILFKVIGKILDWESTPVSAVMTPDPVSLQKTDMIAYAMNNMHTGGYRHVPIVDDQNHPVAIISVKDLLNYILDSFPKHILNIPPSPFRGVSERESA